MDILVSWLIFWAIYHWPSKCPWKGPVGWPPNQRSLVAMILWIMHLWNLAGDSTAMLWSHLPNFKAIWLLNHCHLSFKFPAYFGRKMPCCSRNKRRESYTMDVASHCDVDKFIFRRYQRVDALAIILVMESLNVIFKITKFLLLSGLGFFRKKPISSGTPGKKWKKPISSSFVRTKLEETGQNWKKLWKMSEMLENIIIILNFLQKIICIWLIGTV